jgi:hypothetical protein
MLPLLSPLLLLLQLLLLLLLALSQRFTTCPCAACVSGAVLAHMPPAPAVSRLLSCMGARATQCC